MPTATPTIRQELLQSTANQTRVANEVKRFARNSAVSVDPRYGTWTVARIVPPPGPGPPTCWPRRSSVVPIELEGSASTSG